MCQTKPPCAGRWSARCARRRYTATDLGLATTPLSQPLEVAQTRASISTHIGPQLFAQLVLRVGWADRGAPELPPTPRRRLDRVLLPSR
ncbi:MAG: hypothetical protein M3Y48_16785 [Actinomycetota bacterium]|nr:hypothetical protein [Actinomycetota bacterium]